MEIIHHHFETLPSTNEWAKKCFIGLSAGTLLLVTAEEQSAGKGQFGRQWISPKGVNVYATFAFLAKEESEPLFFTRLLALSAASALQDIGIKATLKWPNDLLVNGKKIAGILCETAPSQEFLAIAAGIGLNVNMSQEHLSSIDQPATSISVEKGEHFLPSSVLEGIKEHFKVNLTRFFEKGVALLEM